MERDLGDAVGAFHVGALGRFFLGGRHYGDAVLTMADVLSSQYLSLAISPVQK